MRKKLILENVNAEKDKIGIYAIFYQDECIYIGQSINLKNRLNTHRRASVEDILRRIYKEDGRANRCKELAFYHFINEHREDIAYEILIETTKEFLNIEEKRFIELYKPRFNYEGVLSIYKGA